MQLYAVSGITLSHIVWSFLQVWNYVQDQNLGIGFRIPGLIRFVGQETAFLSNACDGPRMYVNLEDHISHQTGQDNVPFQVTIATRHAARAVWATSILAAAASSS